MNAGCGSSCPVAAGFYAYSPNIGGNVFVLVVYTLILLKAVYLGLKSHTPCFSVILGTGHLLGLLGFAGRVLLRQSHDRLAFFLLSLLGTLLGPALTSASIFVVFSHIINVYGEHLSPFKPILVELLLYPLITVAIGIQAVGSIFVAYGFNGITTETSTSIIVAGLSIQAVALLGSAAAYFYLVFELSSIRSVLEGKHSKIYATSHFGTFLRGIEISTTILLAYSVYRVVEIAGGMNGELFQSETAFMIMNGAFPLASAVILTTLHPYFAFGEAWKQTSSRQSKRWSPSPIREQEPRISYNTHHAYNPNIRKQYSPNPIEEHQVASNTYRPDMLSRNPGLPSNPRPIHKPPSPTIVPSRSAAATSKRFSDRSKGRDNLQQSMVDSDSLW